MGSASNLFLNSVAVKITHIKLSKTQSPKNPNFTVMMNYKTHY